MLDVAAVSMAMNQSKLKQQASLAVMSTTKDMVNVHAAGLIEMMSQPIGNNAPHPFLGGVIDTKA